MNSLRLSNAIMYLIDCMERESVARRLFGRQKAIDPDALLSNTSKSASITTTPWLTLAIRRDHACKRPFFESSTLSHQSYRRRCALRASRYLRAGARSNAAADRGTVLSRQTATRYR